MRILRWLKWRHARHAFLSSCDGGGQSKWSSASETRRAAVRQLPRLAPYERLGAHYHRFSASFCPRYEDLLAALAVRFQFPIRHVLDVACGAGTLTARLAPRFEKVVGVDVSRAMLAAAQKACGGLTSVRLCEGDYRTFELGERFDAATCACDSLNYVDSPRELSDVFRRVAAHLRPGGLFAFDVLDAYSMQLHATLDAVHESDGVRFAMCTEYDDKARKECTYVAFADGVEAHVRVPIAKRDVTRAAREAGFSLVDAFTDRLEMRRYYVLRLGEGRGDCDWASDVASEVDT